MTKLRFFQRITEARKNRNISRFDEFLIALTWKASAFRTVSFILIIVASHWLIDAINWFYVIIGSDARVSDAQSRYSIGFLTAICIFRLILEFLGWIALIIQWRRKLR